MEDELTCCICLELYKEPVTLPCAHSLCRNCMNEVANGTVSSLSLRPFSCPTCRFYVQSHHFNDLKENKLLSNIVAAYRREKGMTGAVPQMVCYIHPTEQLLLYCQSCKKAVCSYCVTEVHHKYSHRVNYIEHLIELEKESVTQLLKETEKNLKEKKGKLDKQKNAINAEKEAGEKMCISLMHQLRTRLTKIKSDYGQKIDATVQDLTVTEKAVESRLGEFKSFSAAFDSMTYKPDRHLHYTKLMNLRKELMTFSLSVSMNSLLQVKETQFPKFALSNVDAVREAIQGFDLLVSDKRPEQDLTLEELIERGLEDENLRAVFDRVMRKRNSANTEESKQVLDVDIQGSESSVCVTNPASNLTTSNSTDSNTTTSGGQAISSAAGLAAASISLLPPLLTVTSGTSRALCEKLKTRLEDFINALQQKQPCDAGNPVLSVGDTDTMLMEISTANPKFKSAGTTSAISCGLPVDSLVSFQALQPQQAVTSKQGTKVGGSFSTQSVTSTSNAFSIASAPPLFCTSFLNNGQLGCTQAPVPVNSTSLSNLSLMPNRERHQQPSLQPESASPVSFRQPEASSSTFAASESNLLADPVFSVGASRKEHKRTQKKAVKRADWSKNEHKEYTINGEICPAPSDSELASSSDNNEYVQIHFQFFIIIGRTRSCCRYQESLYVDERITPFKECLQEVSSIVR